MSPEEIKELSRLEECYKVKASNLTKYDDVMELLQYAKAAAVIDFIRKDLKCIVDNAVKDALSKGDEKLYDDPNYSNEFAELDDDIQEPSEELIIDSKRRHPMGDTSFHLGCTRVFLEAYGVVYLEDIKGYTSGNRDEGSVPLIIVGDEPNNNLWPIPFDCFEDLENTMTIYNVPFKEIE